MSTSQARVGGPWYVYFWPWFIVSLLGISVLGSLTTVFIAYRHRDRDVRELLVEPNAPARSVVPDSALPASGSGSGTGPPDVQDSGERG